MNAQFHKLVTAGVGCPYVVAWVTGWASRGAASGSESRACCQRRGHYRAAAVDTIVWAGGGYILASWYRVDDNEMK